MILFGLFDLATWQSLASKFKIRFPLKQNCNFYHKFLKRVSGVSLC